MGRQNKPPLLALTAGGVCPPSPLSGAAMVHQNKPELFSRPDVKPNPTLPPSGVKPNPLPPSGPGGED